MGKAGDVKRGGSSRFSAAMRQTGGDSDGILDKSSKKEKLRKLNSVGEMDHSSQSTSTNTSSKRLKLPRKFFHDCDTVVHASVPRKLRSAMKKRDYESLSPPSPNPRNGIRRFEMQSKDRKKKLKVDADEQQHSIMSKSIAEQITKDEEEVMVALVAMAGMFPGNDKTDEINLNNEASEAEASFLQDNDDSMKTLQAPTASKSEDLVQENMQMETLNEATNTVDVQKDSEDVTDGKKSRKRCSFHVYICQLIKDLQVTEGKQINSRKEPKQRTHVDVKTDTNPENTMNGYADKASNEASMAHKTLFQDQRNACGVEGSSLLVAQNHANVPVTHLSVAASEQVSVPPYFGSPLYDPSQWLRPAFPKQQMWMNQFIPGARYQSWQNGRREMMPPHCGSYVEMSSSKYLQASLLDVVGSKDTQYMPQQLHYKMQFDHGSSRYDENGGLFLVDSSPTLKLTLQ